MIENEFLRNLRHILNGQISLSKAAAILGVSYYQMLEILRDKKAAFIAIRKDELEEETNAAKGGMLKRC